MKNKINSIPDLKRELKIEDIYEIRKPEIQKTLLEFILAGRVSLDLVKQLLTIVPELSKMFTEVIKVMASLGTSLEETKRARWLALQNIASTKILNGDQIIEAMHIIQDIEKEESINYKKIFQDVLKVLGIIAGAGLAIVIFILSRGRVKFKI